MRKIKFRGKRVDNGEWAYGDLIHRYDNWIYIAPMPSGTEINPIEVDPSTVGQYTGLTDKNDKEIYEGDVVEHEDFSGGLYIFKEQPKTKGIIKISNLLSGIYLKGMGTFKGRKVEIIGNIHDNPELLGGAE